MMCGGQEKDRNGQGEVTGSDNVKDSNDYITCPWSLTSLTLAVAWMFHMMVRACGALMYSARSTKDASTETEVIQTEERGTWVNESKIHLLERQLDTKEYEL